MPGESARSPSATRRAGGVGELPRRPARGRHRAALAGREGLLGRHELPHVGDVAGHLAGAEVVERCVYDLRRRQPERGRAPREVAVPVAPGAERLELLVTAPGVGDLVERPHEREEATGGGRRGVVHRLHVSTTNRGAARRHHPHPVGYCRVPGYRGSSLALLAPQPPWGPLGLWWSVAEV